MFCVYGVDITTATKRARSQLDKDVPSFKRFINQSAYNRLLRMRAGRLYIKMKPLKISAELSTPERCAEFMTVARKTTLCRNMSTYIHVPKLNKSGGVMKNKRTDKPTLTWELYDPRRNYSEKAAA